MENQITKVFYVRTKNPKSTGNQGREQGTIPRKYSFAFVKFLFPPSSSLCVETGEAEQKLSLPRSGKTERPMCSSLLPDKMHEKCQDRYVLNDMESIRMFSMYMLYMYPIILKTFEIEAIVS